MATKPKPNPFIKSKPKTGSVSSGNAPGPAYEKWAKKNGKPIPKKKA